MKTKRIKLINFIFAVLLTIVTITPIIISHFTFPIELVLLNQRSYSSVLEKEDLVKEYPGLISDILTNQIFNYQIAGGLPDVFSNRDTINASLRTFIPAEWTKNSIEIFVYQSLEFLNFRLPDSSLAIETGELKSELIKNSTKLSETYLFSLVNCNQESIRQLDGATNIYELPNCKPNGENQQKAIGLTSAYLEDLINQLPSRFYTDKLTDLGELSSNNYFFSYSIVRWVLRLIPLVSIILLIIIAVLLRNNKKIMLGWTGSLLIFTSLLNLVALIVILIGFDQLVVILTSQILNNLIEGFRVLLLSILQDVGYKTLSWVLISTFVALGFGIFLVIIARVIRIEEDNPSKENQNQAQKKDKFSDDSEKTIKEIIPQTLEEIESEEKSNEKSI